MVADISGSMDGSPLAEAKTIMKDFLDSVQFEKGDKVELIAFSTGVELVREFTDDESGLKSDIDAMTTKDMTSLYDALFAAVQRVASQPGAKCVIAFTDGQDNYSNSTVSDVIDVASRYKVPVFIVGIGSVDTSALTNIATSTGGQYYSVSTVSGMQGIYDQIYMQEKELYVIEFEAPEGTTVDDTMDLLVGFHNRDYAGESRITYTPRILMDVNSATPLFSNGPEAVVEGYIRNWAPAISHSDVSYIAPYMKYGSDIYDMQSKYIQNDIQEQLSSYEITGCTISGSTATVTTRETFYVQPKGKSLELLTQECIYKLEKDNNGWLMVKLEKVKTVNRIKQ